MAKNLTKIIKIFGPESIDSLTKNYEFFWEVQ